MPAKHRLLTAASCTTNCLAPVVKMQLRGRDRELLGFTLTDGALLRRALVCGSCEIMAPVPRLDPGRDVKADYRRDDCSHKHAAAKF